MASGVSLGGGCSGLAAHVEVGRGRRWDVKSRGWLPTIGVAGRRPVLMMAAS